MSNIERLAIRIDTNTAAAGTTVTKPVEGKVLEWVCSGSTRDGTVRAGFDGDVHGDAHR